MPTPLDEEAIFAAIGLQRVIDGKPRLWKYRLGEAADLARVVRKRILAFLASDAFKDAVDVPDFDYATVLDEVSAGQTPEQAAALLEAIPDPDLATDLGIRAKMIQEWAYQAMPRRTSAGSVGAREDDPDPSSQADFRRAWQVALDPLSVLADLEDGSLSPDQVATLAQLFPAIYGDVRLAVREALATMKARRGEAWEPAVRKAALLGTLLQEDTTDVELAAACQQIYAQEAQENAQAAPKPSKRRAAGATGEAEATPGQRASVG